MQIIDLSSNQFGKWLTQKQQTNNKNEQTLGRVDRLEAEKGAKGTETKEVELLLQKLKAKTN